MKVPRDMVYDVMESLGGFSLDRWRVREALENALRSYPDPDEELHIVHAAWQGALAANRRLKRQILFCVALLLANAVVLVSIAARSCTP